MSRARHFLAVGLLALIATLHAEDKPLLLELPIGMLPSAVGANGAIVVGSSQEPRAYYWMPTTRDIFMGGRGAAAVSRDGRIIASVSSPKRCCGSIALPST